MKVFAAFAIGLIIVGACEPARDKQLDVQRAGLVRELAAVHTRAGKRLAECDAVEAKAKAGTRPAEGDEQAAPEDALTECAANRRTFAEVVGGLEAKIADIDAVQKPLNAENTVR